MAGAMTASLLAFPLFASQVQASQVQASPAGKGAAAVAASVDAQASVAVAEPLNDGPYISYGEKRITARWVCDGKLIERTYRAHRWPVTVQPVCGYDKVIQVRAPDTRPATILAQDVQRVVALSDIHGQYRLLLRLLQANGVLDAHAQWALGDGHLVIVGDVFDRGPGVTEALWLLYGLQQQARDAGGALDLLLGNHETMVLYDDLRYVNEKYLRVADVMAMPYPRLYSADSVLGQWIRTRPAIGQVNDMLFVHGGMSPAFLSLGLARDETNARYRTSLGLPKAQMKQDPIFQPLYDGKTSPIWYRGYFRADGLDKAGVDAVAKQLGVRHIVVGHTSMQHVEGYFDGTVIAVDSSIKNGESGEVLFVEEGRMSRGNLAGTRLPLVNGDVQPSPED